MLVRSKNRWLYQDVTRQEDTLQLDVGRGGTPGHVV